MRRMTIGGAALALAILGSTAGAATMLDPTTLTRPGSPNNGLICPPHACAGKADGAPPVFAMLPDQLLARWEATIRAEPRTAITGVDSTAGLIEAQQKSRVFGFVDVVAIKVLPAANGGSTFAAFSKSTVGYYDFGVNKRRLAAWTEALERLLTGA